MTKDEQEEVKRQAQDQLDDCRTLINQIQEPLGHLHMRIHSSRLDVSATEVEDLKEVAKLLRRALFEYL